MPYISEEPRRRRKFGNKHLQREKGRAVRLSLRSFAFTKYKNNLLRSDAQSINEVNTHSSEESTKSEYSKESLDFNKPREEFSFYDFHPKLPTEELLPVYKSHCERNERRNLVAKLNDIDNHCKDLSDSERRNYILSHLRAQKNLRAESIPLYRQAYFAYEIKNLPVAKIFEDRNDFDTENVHIINRPEYLLHSSDFQLAYYDLPVEYDIDEVDDEWLRMYNSERNSQNLESISYDLFELAMTIVEREWAKIQQYLSYEELGEDDASCAVCDLTESTEDNTIVFCDGCNIAVHQNCYGIPYIPEGQWLCRKCILAPFAELSCLFCPNKGGAFKQTTEGHWAHMLCSMFISEITIGNMTLLEPIDNVNTIPPERWQLVCYICRIRGGACVQCSHKSCYTPFHVTCARKAQLYLHLDHDLSSYESRSYTAYCHRHSPASWKSLHDSDAKFDQAVKYFRKNAHKLQIPKYKKLKSKLVQNSEAIPCSRLRISVGLGRQKASLPNFVIHKLREKLKAYRISNESSFFTDICKYHSLKRDAKKGAPLLRVQRPLYDLSPSSICSKIQKRKRVTFLEKLFEDYSRVRAMLQLVKDREETKLNLFNNMRVYAEFIGSLSSADTQGNEKSNEKSNPTRQLRPRRCVGRMSYATTLVDQPKGLVSRQGTTDKALLVQNFGLDGLDYDQNYWPGREVREMSPLSDASDSC